MSDNVAELTYTALAYLSVFPLIDAIVSSACVVRGDCCMRSKVGSYYEPCAFNASKSCD